MVERYRLWCQDSDAEITREPNGGWVRHSDYEALERQIAEAQAGNAEHSRKWWQAERELLAVKAERDRWKGEYLNACRDAANFFDDLVKAEAERDRLAAEVEAAKVEAGEAMLVVETQDKQIKSLAAEVTRLKEALERVLNAAGCGVDLYNDEPGREAIRNARAALASVKE